MIVNHISWHIMTYHYISLIIIITSLWSENIFLKKLWSKPSGGPFLGPVGDWRVISSRYGQAWPEAPQPPAQHSPWPASHLVASHQHPGFKEKTLSRTKIPHVSWLCLRKSTVVDRHCPAEVAIWIHLVVFWDDGTRPAHDIESNLSYAHCGRCRWQKSWTESPRMGKQDPRPRPY